MVGAFVDTLAGLRAGRIEQAELDSVRSKLPKRYDTPDLGAAKLPSDALGPLGVDAPDPRDPAGRPGDRLHPQGVPLRQA
ncbi:hypothetical protein FB157_10617 [Streptomyces sp. BK340]|nr:hypothetical protein FB157_10617 [Streptomyces sp. BK340]